MGIMDQRNQALESLRRIRKEERDLLEEYFEKAYTNEELGALEEAFSGPLFSGKHYIAFRSDGNTLIKDLSWEYANADLNVITCDFEDVPLYIKSISDKSSRSDLITHVAATWRLKIGK